MFIYNRSFRPGIQIYCCFFSTFFFNYFYLCKLEALTNITHKSTRVPYWHIWEITEHVSLGIRSSYDLCLYLWIINDSLSASLLLVDEGMFINSCEVTGNKLLFYESIFVWHHKLFSHLLCYVNSCLLGKFIYGLTHNIGFLLDCS